VYYFNPPESGIFDEIIESLLDPAEPWLTLADFRSYINAQQSVSKAYKEKASWTKMS